MEFKRYNQHLINVVISLLVGLLYVFMSFPIIGIGAAISVPKNVFLPIVQLSPTLALSLSDLITIGVPLAAFFCLLTVVTSRICKVVYPVYLVTPFVVFMLYGLHSIIGNDQGALNSALIFAKTLPVLVCAIFLAKQDVSHNET